MQDRERHLARRERLDGEVQQDRGVLADAVEHHRAAERAGGLTEDVDGLGLERVQDRVGRDGRLRVGWQTTCVGDLSDLGTPTGGRGRDSHSARLRPTYPIQAAATPARPPPLRHRALSRGASVAVRTPCPSVMRDPGVLYVVDSAVRRGPSCATAASGAGDRRFAAGRESSPKLAGAGMRAAASVLSVLSTKPFRFHRVNSRELPSWSCPVGTPPSATPRSPCCCEVGYDRMSMDAVAARAHASKATIYRRWPGKQELVLDAVRARGVGLDGRRGHRLACGATWWRPTAAAMPTASAADDADADRRRPAGHAHAPPSSPTACAARSSRASATSSRVIVGPRDRPRRAARGADPDPARGGQRSLVPPRPRCRWPRGRCLHHPRRRRRPHAAAGPKQSVRRAPGDTVTEPAHPCRRGPRRGGTTPPPPRPRPAALAGAGRARGRPADDRPRRVDREHRAARRRRRTSASATPTGSGWSRPTRWPSAACCCSAAGSPTTPAASAPSSSACSASPAPRRSAASRPTRSCCSRPAPCRARFAALMAPAALSIVTVTFTEPKERAKAFGVFGALAGGGAAIGLIVGGVLTEYASWRWCLGVNVPVALIVAAAARSRSCTRARRTATPGTTSPACCSPRSACSRWSTASPRPPGPKHPDDPRRHLGAGLGRLRRRSTFLVARGRAARRVRALGDAGPRTRCCRCASCSTATAAGPTWSSCSSAPGCSRCSCS